MTGPDATSVSPAARSGVSIRVALVLALVLLLALGGTTAWAVMTNGDLERSRQTLATTEADLASTSSRLATRTGELEAASAALADERSSIKKNESRIKVLETQIRGKSQCIKAQTTNLAEFQRILALDRANFDRTSTGSVWAKAHAAGDKAVDLAIDYLAKAYLAAAAGSYGTANSWVGKSNAQIDISNRQIKIGNKEIDAINAATDSINAANDELRKKLDATATICGG
jgi:peptidoglycan hydrolase CwlO-like protein